MEDEMYANLFRKLPGGPVSKALLFALIIFATICLMFFVVFPFVEIVIAEDPSLNV
jgi:hypothetical protein